MIMPGDNTTIHHHLAMTIPCRINKVVQIIKCILPQPRRIAGLLFHMEMDKTRIAAGQLCKLEIPLVFSLSLIININVVIYPLSNACFCKYFLQFETSV